MSASELGSVSVAIGIGEMIGELAVILVGDRYSKCVEPFDTIEHLHECTVVIVSLERSDMRPHMVSAVDLYI